MIQQNERDFEMRRQYQTSTHAEDGENEEMLDDLVRWEMVFELRFAREKVRIRIRRWSGERRADIRAGREVGHQPTIENIFSTVDAWGKLACLCA